MILKEGYTIDVSLSDLLQQMATLGKQDNVFAVLNKAADASQANQNHPLFGFKKDLIRLLGNMVYKNRQNQDRVSPFLSTDPTGSPFLT